VAGRRLPALPSATASALRDALAVVTDRLDAAVERLSLGRADIPLVVVGGGGFLVPDRLPSAGEILRPDHGGVANAVGAAISLAGGRADQMAPMGDRESAIEQASEAAIAKAIQAGADPLDVSIVEILETHVPYTAQPTVNVS